MLPNFFVVGAQKAGTTSFYHYLIGHPEIYLAPEKETKFFVNDDIYRKGIVFYEGTYFSGWGNEKAVGEVDPDYMYFNKAIVRMARDLTLDLMKFIFLFRNPVDRAFSHYLMTYRRGLEPHSFEKAIVLEKERIGRDFLSDMHFSYTRRGFYYRQVKEFLNYVDQSQLHFILSDDLDHAPKEALKGCFDFLGVATDYVPEIVKNQFHTANIPRSVKIRRYFDGDSIPKKFFQRVVPFSGFRKRLRAKLLELNQKKKVDLQMREDTRRKLSKIFTEENKRLSDLIGEDLTGWDNQ